jgi:hypothetical protein
MFGGGELMLILGLALSKRRQQMAEEINTEHNGKTAEFDYRRRIADDIRVLLKESDAFKIGESASALDRYEQTELIYRLAEDIAAYIVK